MRETFLICTALAVLQGAAGCGAENAGAATAATRPADGAALYRQYCVTCHGVDGALGLNGAKNLAQSILSAEERAAQIAKGKNLMTPFEEILTPEEIRAVAQYSLTLKKQ